MNSNVNLDSLRSELLALHKAGIQAHLEKNVPFFVQDVSDDFISVSRGEIHRPTIEDTRSMFTNYLENATFSEYKDLQEPIIGLSNDGSLGWAIVQVKVMGKRTIDGTEMDMDFISSWMMLYERKDNRWIRIVNASTFK